MVLVRWAGRSDCPRFGRARSRAGLVVEVWPTRRVGDVLEAGLDALTDRGLLTRRTDRQRLLTIGFDDLRGILHRASLHRPSPQPANGLPAPTLSLQPADAHGRRVSAGEWQGALDGRFHGSADHDHRDDSEEQCVTAEEEPATSRALDPGGAPLAGPLRPIRCRVRAGQDEPRTTRRPRTRSPSSSLRPPRTDQD